MNILNVEVLQFELFIENYTIIVNKNQASSTGSEN